MKDQLNNPQQQQNIFTIEVCSSCDKHIDLHEKNEEPQIYQKNYETAHNLLYKIFPNCKIIKLQNPRVGSFEIKHKNHLLWSKFLFKKFPEKSTLEQKLYTYYQDMKGKKSM